MVIDMIKLKVLFLYIKILFNGRKRSIAYMLINTIAEILNNLALIYIPSVMIALFTSSIEISAVITCFAIFFISTFIKRIMSLKLNTEKELQDQILIMTITDKMNRIPYYHLEKFEIKKKRESCIYAIQNYGAAYDLYTKCINILSAATTSISILILAIRFKAYYMVIIVLLSCLYLFVNYMLISKKHKYSDATIDYNYKYSYYQEVLIQKKYQINNKLYDYSKILLDNFRSLNHKITQHFQKIRATEASYESMFSIILNAQTTISYIFPIVRLLKETISVSEFVLLANCGMQVANKINTIASSIQSVSQSLDYLIPLYELMNIPETSNENCVNKFESLEKIEFNSVSFKYPDTNDYVLRDVNLEIKQGEKVAIIGLNGAGKTTLIKLLLRLYEPTTGEILINSKPIQSYDSSFMNKVSVVFQDCKLFPITIYENIIANKPCDNLSNINDICVNTHFDKVISSKKCSLDSLCSSEIYDTGVEFSGGERQLLAITRASFRDGDLFVLDEPSSALDPLMRREIISNFKEITRNKTSILITHDVALAKKCDRIIKIESGHAREIVLENLDELTNFAI